MKEWGILFQAAMVRAILAGTKTQTRRPLYVIRKVGRDNAVRAVFHNQWPAPARILLPGEYWTLGKWHNAKPGDRLWVRETWGPCEGGFCYFADEPPGSRAKPDDGRWHPSIHMPRVVCRLEPTVTANRIERLWDISREDALAEGIVQLADGGYGLPAGEHYHAVDPRESYWSLWDAINEDADTNPALSAITFQRATP